jgi:hypothetical protein
MVPTDGRDERPRNYNFGEYSCCLDYSLVTVRKKILMALLMNIHVDFLLGLKVQS